jgi:hypothetical protein
LVEEGKTKKVVNKELTGCIILGQGTGAGNEGQPHNAACSVPIFCKPTIVS